MNAVALLIVFVGSLCAGTFCVRRVRAMNSTGVAYFVLDWRALFWPRVEYSRAENPILFRWCIFLTATFATFAFVFAVASGVGLVSMLTLWRLS